MPKAKFNPYLKKRHDGSLQVTAAGERYLKKIISDHRRPVYAFHGNYNPVIAAAAMARLSRRAGDMRVTILDEFALSGAKEEQLLNRVITQFGDDSVQQLVGLHVTVEGASNILTKQLEWGRLGAYLEQSTRYIYLDQKDNGGHYNYFIPKNLSQTLQRQYKKILDKIFDNYSEVVRKLAQYISENSSVPAAERDIAWRGAIRAQACDAARAMLPVATKLTVGIFASAQALESLVMHLLSEDLIEARETGEAILEQLRKVAPVFFERADRPDRGGALVAYRANTKNALKILVEANLKLAQPVQLKQAAQLVEFWPKHEFDLVPYMLFEHSKHSLAEIKDKVKTWPDKKKLYVFKAYVGERLNRRHKPGRALEQAHYRWDIVCDYGIFRDLQRHRMVDDLRWQKLTPDYGFDMPELILKADLEQPFQDAFDLSAQLYNDISAAGYTPEAQYATLLGHKMRWTMMYNAREAFHLHELRTSPQGHPGYRKLVKEMHDQVAKVHPNLAKAMIFVNKDDDPELTRLAAERYTQFKLNQLNEKTSK